MWVLFQEEVSDWTKTSTYCFIFLIIGGFLAQLVVSIGNTLITTLILYNIVALLLPLFSKKKQKDMKEGNMEKNSKPTEERMSKYRAQKGFIEEEFNHMSEINGKI